MAHPRFSSSSLLHFTRDEGILSHLLLPYILLTAPCTATPAQITTTYCPHHHSRLAIIWLRHCHGSFENISGHATLLSTPSHGFLPVRITTKLSPGSIKLYKSLSGLTFCHSCRRPLCPSHRPRARLPQDLFTGHLLDHVSAWLSHTPFQSLWKRHLIRPN